MRIVVGDDEQILGRWSELQPFDLDGVEPGSFALLPLLFRRLSDLGADDPLVARLESTYRSTWYRNNLYVQRLVATAAAFQTDGIEFVAFGDAPLAAHWYPQLGLRPITQLEAIVEAGSGDRARETMKAAGWRPAGSGAGYSRYVGSEGFVFLVHDRVPPLLAGPVAADRAFEALRAEARERDFGGVSITTPAPADEFLLACVQRAHAATVSSVQWLLDAARTLDALDAAGAALLVRHAGLFRVVPAVRQTVEYLGEVGVPVESVAQALTSRRDDRRDRVAYRLAGASADRFGNLPRALGLHLRATADDPLLRALAGVPRFLQESWELERVSQLPRAAVKKLTSITNRRRSQAKAGHGTLSQREVSTDQPPPPGLSTERKRSASS